MDWELILEAERRGILPPDKVELLAEARRRGLVPAATAPQPAAPVQAATAEPAAAPAPAPVAPQAVAAAAQPAAMPAQPVAAAQPAAMPPPAAASAPSPEEQMPPEPTAPAAPQMTYEQTFGIRPTTAAGVAGAITRAAVPIAAGAAAGGAVAGPPGAAIGAGTMALAPAVLDPAVRVFNRVFGTNVSTVSEALQNAMTRLGVAQPETPTERAVEAGTRGVAAGVAGPAGAARAVQAVAPAGSTAARVAEAVRVGGMGPTGAGGITGLPGAGVRGGAAATAGGIGGFAAEPTAAGAVSGAAFGAVTPAVGAVVKSISLGAWDATVGRLWRPQQTAEQALLNALSPDATPAQQIQRGREAVTAITRGMPARPGAEGTVGTPVTPGYQRNLVEILEAGGVQPTVDMAALASRLENAGGDVADRVLQFQRNQVTALRQQLLQINDQLRVPMLTPGRKEELTGVRDNILARIDAEEAVARAAERARIKVSAGPQTAGKVLQQRAELMRAEIKHLEVDPRYQRAMDAAGSEPNIPVPGVARAVRSIYGDQLSTLMPDSLPDTVKIANRLAAARGDELPEVSNLATLHNLRKALNKESREAVLSGNLDRDKNIKSILNSINNAINNATGLPQEAKRLYGEANAFYRDVYSYRFGRDAGETAKLLQPTKYGGNVIDPSETVAKFLANEDAADQFIRTFAGDPVAFSALSDGIVSVARKAALDGFTVSPQKLENWLAKNAFVLRRYEEAGMNVRGALYRMEQDANAAEAAFNNLKAQRGPFTNKTPDDILRYITSDPARMRLALDRSDDVGKETIRRVVAEQLNQTLESNPQAALKELTDETTRAAYRQAFPARLVDDATERARMGVAARAALADPLLARPGAAEQVVTRSNLTLPQLRALLTVAEGDIARIKRIDEAARRGGATPRVGMITREVAEAGAPAAAVTPNSSMNTAMNALVRTFTNIEQRVNRKVNAELARVIYENPESAITAINNAIARAERAQRPAGMTRRVAPAAAGAVGGMVGEQVRQQYQSEPTQ